MEHEAAISDEKFSFLQRLASFDDIYCPECQKLIEDNQEMINTLEDGIQRDIEDVDSENDLEEEENCRPEICVRWPWR